MKWNELAHEKHGHLYPTAIYWLGAQYVCKEVGINDSIIGVWYKDHEFSYLSTPGGFLRAAKIILQKLHERDFLQKIIDCNKTCIPKMLKAAEKLSGDLSKVPGKELLKRWNEWIKHFLDLMTYSAMGTVMEMEEPIMTMELEALLHKKVKDDPKKGTYFQVLLTSTELTIAGKEEIDLLKLRIKQLEDKADDKDIIDHTNKYSFIAFNYDGPSWKPENIKLRLKELPADISEVKALMSEKEQAPNNIKKEQQEIIKKIKLSEHEAYLFEVLRTLGFWKFERKFMNQKGHELMEDFIHELCNRYNLTVPQAKMIAPNEMEDVLLHNKVDKELLNERIKESVVVYHGLNYEVLSGKSAEKVLSDIHRSLEIDEDIKELKGSTAYPGKVVGTVNTIDTVEDMEKMNQGDILVSMSTSPDILPAMKKAAAIVTDTGGITCHAAIVAREIKIPTVIGTKLASKWLKDGDKVEVDADNGIVKKR